MYEQRLIFAAASTCGAVLPHHGAPPRIAGAGAMRSVAALCNAKLASAIDHAAENGGARDCGQWVALATIGATAEKIAEAWGRTTTKQSAEIEAFSKLCVEIEARLSALEAARRDRSGSESRNSYSLAIGRTTDEISPTEAHRVVERIASKRSGSAVWREALHRGIAALASSGVKSIVYQMRAALSDSSGAKIEAAVRSAVAARTTEAEQFLNELRSAGAAFESAGVALPREIPSSGRPSLEARQ